MVGMSLEQIAADYADWFNIPFDIARQRMIEPAYRQAYEAGRQSGLGKIWETLYGLAVDKKDPGMLILLAKEQLKLFGQVEADEVMVKSVLTKDKLKKIYDLIFSK